MMTTEHQCDVCGWTSRPLPADEAGLELATRIMISHFMTQHPDPEPASID
jgi:hypothetical protein